MSAAEITHLIITYRYVILIPLAIAEGPVVAFIAATLASLGYFNIWVICIIFAIRDLGMDAVYYAIGYYGNRAAFVHRILAKLKVGEKEIGEVRKLWAEHPFRTMLIGKLSYGIASTFVAIAGMIQVRILTFFKYSVWVTIAQFGTMIALGYFFGNAFGDKLSNIVAQSQLVIGIGFGVIALYYVISWYIRKKFRKEEEEVDREGV